MRRSGLKRRRPCAGSTLQSRIARRVPHPHEDWFLTWLEQGRDFGTVTDYRHDNHIRIERFLRPYGAVFCRLTDPGLAPGAIILRTVRG